ncbi:SAVED domain-containing protein [cf. Phormidesmis sp. LEGE 11477]|uniref:SAVED domain-containing protein n=1 Tax=cf. Phormidesmis sp. LEGE 11477 TaxID=1828680 RepID=UPI0018822498|nr:SAVED domain-containing protein [cf. Phormidesmis sp. LEGE 11477]MBE9065014.1 SAVED domain-containing protein [cf. Phormidesmis sp. LEGE 11477]
MKGLFFSIVDKASGFFADYFGAGSILSRCGLAICVAALSTPILELFLSTVIDFELPPYFREVAFLVGVLMIIVGVLWRREAEIRDIKIAVEVKGLRMASWTDLRSFFPKSQQSRIAQITIDLTDKIEDGEVLNFAFLQKSVREFRANLNSRKQQYDDNDIKIYFGGLAPVPVLFAFGIQLDDDGGTTVLDWDRIREKWIMPNAASDSPDLYFSEVPNTLPDEILIACSISYAVDKAAIEERFAGLPVLEIVASEFGCHPERSLEFHQRVCDEFTSYMRRIHAAGVKRIHMVLAAPSSVCINLGRVYDKRLFPPIWIYQYERDAEKGRYNWRANMPVAKTEFFIEET